MTSSKIMAHYFCSLNESHHRFLSLWVILKCSPSGKTTALSVNDLPLPKTPSMKEQNHIDCISTSRTAVNNAALSSSDTCSSQQRIFPATDRQGRGKNISYTDSMHTQHMFKHRDVQVQQRLQLRSYRKTSAYINSNANQGERERDFFLDISGWI